MNTFNLKPVKHILLIILFSVLAGLAAPVINETYAEFELISEAMNHMENTHPNCGCTLSQVLSDLKKQKKRQVPF